MLGKWYYEVEMLSDNLFQIGWVNDRFVPDPLDGKGVGDCSNSWAVDLYRNAKWHEMEDGMATRLPYGGDRKWEAGGILQVLLLSPSSSSSSSSSPFSSLSSSTPNHLPLQVLPSPSSTSSFSSFPSPFPGLP